MRKILSFAWCPFSAALYWVPGHKSRLLSIQNPGAPQAVRTYCSWGTLINVLVIHAHLCATVMESQP